MPTKHSDSEAESAYLYARSFFKEQSPKTYWSLWLFTTRENFRHFVCIYAYFRWADDIVDAPQRDAEKVQGFCLEQETLIKQERAPQTSLEKALLLSIQAPQKGDVFQRICLKMWESLSFDAHRPSFVRPQKELFLQICRIGDSYAQALWACSQAKGEMPNALQWLARAATATHHLRDIDEDLELRYCNIPQEAIAHYGLDPDDLSWPNRAPYILERSNEIFLWFARGFEALPLISHLPTRLLFWLFGYRYKKVLLKIQKKAIFFCKSRPEKYRSSL